MLRELDEAMKRILLNAVLAAMSACLAFGSGAPCLAKEEPYGHIMLSKRQNVNEETETTIDKNQLHARSAVLMDADTGRVLFLRWRTGRLTMWWRFRLMRPPCRM